MRGAGIYKGWVAMKQAVGEQQKIEQRDSGPIKSIIFLRTLETPLFNDHDLPLHLSSLRFILLCRVQALQGTFSPPSLFLSRGQAYRFTFRKQAVYMFAVELNGTRARFESLVTSRILSEKVLACDL